jgi:hypothetical protein
VLLCCRLRSTDRGELLRVHLSFDDCGVHHGACLAFADRGELLRVDVDGLLGSWFEPAVLDFEPARGPVLALLREPHEIAAAAAVSVYGLSHDTVSDVGRGDF